MEPRGMTGDQVLPPEEPLLDVDDIQGNALPGFMKPHMIVLALAIGDVRGAREFLRGLKVTSLAEVMTSRVHVRAIRTLNPSGARIGAVPDGLDDLWLNLGLSYRGLQKLAKDRELLNKQLEDFTDAGFRLGLAARSSSLGDPTATEAEGHPGNWVVGGPGKEPDILLVLAGDDPTRVEYFAKDLRRSAEQLELDVLHEDRGAKFDARGSEHFGFQDGISQPGVRGRVGEHAFLAYRQIEPSIVPDTWLYGLPGQLLVWPGEFVFGYPGSSADPLVPGPVKQPGPSWSRNGSYLVFRRLRQDVAGFWDFMATEAKRLSGQPGFEGWTDHRLAAALVGRWKSGAPLLRAPDADNEELGADRLANNSFGYGKPAGTLGLVDGQTTNGRWPEAVADPVGLVCPLAAHIRKVNSRESPNDMGASRASLDRRILRRGLPYGEPLRVPAPGQADGADQDDGERGLLFISYQSSIADQFEFLNNRWMGSPVNPRSPSGHDMVVGQNGQPGEHRERSCVVFGKDLEEETISTSSDYVIPTGGGYFFSPSISALRDTLASG
jgi:Dyp-type peroxidase family